MIRALQTPLRRNRGLSLIELMVALLISSIVVLGLVTLINAIGLANRTQDGLARLQENGRFALQRIASDVRLAGAQHCSKDNVVTPIFAAGASSYVDPPRFSLTYFNAAATTGNGPGMGPSPGVPDPTYPNCTGSNCYAMSPRFMFMGHECDATNCVPALNAANRGINRLGTAIPALGTAAGQRARGADVITLRHFSTIGALVVDLRDFLPGAPNVEFDLQDDAAVLAREGFDTMAAGDPIWMSDCSNAMFLRGTLNGTRTIRMTGNFDNSGIMPVQVSTEFAGAGTDADARAFHLPTSLRTVSYYLQLKNDPKAPGRLISALIRKVDAQPAQELVEGVERFDLLYGVRDGLGNTRFLTAAQVDALAAGSECVGVVEPGCGWRSVKSVEVYLLINTVDDVTPVGDDEFRYSWLNSGAANAAGAFENPQSFASLRNGLPPGRMLRREFRTTVSMRGNNF